MKDWIALVFPTLLVPLTMVGFGWLLSKKAPKSINWLFGYRTSRSMKNDETWRFAQKKIGRLWLIWGSTMLLLTLALLLILFGKDDRLFEKAGLVLTVVQLVVLILSIIPVERALKRNFDKDGRRIDGPDEA